MAPGIKKADEAIGEQWLTLPQAADLLGIHKQTVLKHALDGKLETEMRAHWRFVSRESVARLALELQKSA